MNKIYPLYLLSTIIALFAYSFGAIDRVYEFWLTSLLYVAIGLFTNSITSKYNIKKRTYIIIVISPYYLILLSLLLFVSRNISNSIYPILFSPITSFIIGVYISKIFDNLLKFILIICFVLISYIIPFKGYPSYYAFVSTNNSNNITFPNINLEDVESNEYKIKENKIIVIEFWQISCGVCYKKMPFFEKIAKRYKENEDIVFYAICLKSKKENIVNIQNRIKKLSYNNFKFLIAHNNSTNIIFDKLKFHAVPRFIIIDKNKKIVFSQSSISEESFYKNIYDVIDSEIAKMEKAHNNI